MSLKYMIYALCHPHTGEIRYVGKSCSGMGRPREHFYPKKVSQDIRQNRWAKCVRTDTGKWPSVSVLETCHSAEEVALRERDFIASFREQGYNLVNIRSGGDGFDPAGAKSASIIGHAAGAARLGGIATWRSGGCAKNNLQLRRPLKGTDLATGEVRWYLSACHASADGMGSRGNIAANANPNCNAQSVKGWEWEYVRP